LTVRAAAEYAAAVVRRALAPGERMAADELEALRALLPERPVDLGEVLRRVVDEVTARLEADRGTLYLIDHARGELVSCVAHLPELAEIRLRLGEGVAGWVARTGECVNVPAGTNDPRFAARIDQQTGYRTHSLLAVPVRAEGGGVVGVLQVLNQRRGRFERADEARLEALAAQVARLLSATSLRSQLRPENPWSLDFRFNHIVGESAGMRAAYEVAARAARTDATVLIRGESGSGKEAFAQAVHYNSPRHERAFVKVDCAALPAGLIENELFGHERGAFTGADAAAEGKVAAAHGGTLFLDEVGELPATVQGKLLRLLQDRTYLKVGGTKPIAADVRFVCATHRDLEGEVAAGRFRQDLYYRLRVVEIVVPPLRARGGTDLDRLIDHFLFELTRRHRRPDVMLSTAARAALHAHDWPGNVRELENCLESAVVLAPGGVIEPAHLRLGPPRGGRALSGEEFVTEVRPLRDVERAYIDHVIERFGGNRSAAARALGIGRNTLLRKLKS
jgi:Nif-specific regulatory protein